MEESFQQILPIVLRIDSSLTDSNINDIITAVFGNLPDGWQEFLVKYYEESLASTSENDEDDDDEFEQFLSNVDTYYDHTEISVKDVERERILDEIFMKKLAAAFEPAFHESLILLRALYAVHWTKFGYKMDDIVLRKCLIQMKHGRESVVIIKRSCQKIMNKCRKTDDHHGWNKSQIVNWMQKQIK